MGNGLVLHTPEKGGLCRGVQGGQLRDMCAQVGLDVVAIRRIRIGRIPLGKMPVGAWRYLPVGERF